MSKQSKDLSLIERLRPWMDELRRCEHRQFETISLNNGEAYIMEDSFNYHPRINPPRMGLFEELQMGNTISHHTIPQPLNRENYERWTDYRMNNNRDIVINVSAAGLKYYQDMITNSLIKPKKKNRWL